MTAKGRSTRERILQTVADLIAQHQAPGLGELDSFAALRLWADLYLERQEPCECQGGCGLGSLARQLVESDPETRGDLASGFRQWLELFRHGFTLMKDRGDLTETANPDALAQALLGAMQGGMLLTQTLRDLAPLRTSLNAALAYAATFATDPDPAVKALRLSLPDAGAATGGAEPPPRTEAAASRRLLDCAGTARARSHVPAGSVRRRGAPS
jgi:TetR/AcrR family transcriptional repressor of nem operon